MTRSALSMTHRFGIEGCAVALCVALATSGCNQKAMIAPALIIEPSTALAHQVGHFDAVQKAMIATPGEKGFVAYGPYAELPAGSYQATFDVVVDGDHGTSGRVDVNAFLPSQTVSVLAASELKPGAQKISLDFTATVGPKYEFRVTSDGTATIRLDGIVVKKHQ